MKKIINLMKLDLICIKMKTLLPLLFFIVAFAVLGFYVGPLFMMPIILFAGICVQSVFTTAEKNDFNKLYGVLPINRSSVVYARFALAVLSIGAVTAVITLLAFAADKAALFVDTDEFMTQIYYNAKQDGFGIPMFGATIFFAACLITSMQYMILFIFGAERETVGTITALLISTVIIFIVSAVNVEFMNNAGLFLGKVYQKSPILLYASMYLLGIAVAAFFALITGAVIKKREL